MLLAINAFRGGHTATHTYQHANQKNVKKPDMCQPAASMPGLRSGKMTI